MRLVSKSLILVLLMLTSTLSIINAETTSRNDNHQPTVNNTTYWLFGGEEIDNGHGHFFFDGNNSDNGSSPKGYGQKQAENGRISINISFELFLSKNMVLEIGEVIRATFFIESWGLTGSDCTGDTPCKHFTATFKKAGLPVASDTFITGGSGQETITWEFPVAENMTEWKKNQDNIEIQVEYEVEAYQGIECSFSDCSAEIYFFYTHPDQNRDNSVTDCDGCNSNIIFPILETDQPLPSDDVDFFQAAAFSIICNNKTGGGIISINTVGENRTGIIKCTIYNPTIYIQNFEIGVGGNFELVFSAPSSLFVSSNNNTEFEVFLKAGDGQRGTSEYIIYGKNKLVNGTDNPNFVTKTATVFVFLDSNDLDGDGVTDDLDVFPQDPTETHDDDNDGVGNNSDAFPQDPTETKDTDGDGVGDNSDADPRNPKISKIDNVTNTALYILSGAIVLLAVVIIVTRRKPPKNVHDYPGGLNENSVWDE